MTPEETQRLHEDAEKAYPKEYNEQSNEAYFKGAETEAIKADNLLEALKSIRQTTENQNVYSLADEAIINYLTN